MERHPLARDTGKHYFTLGGIILQDPDNLVKGAIKDVIKKVGKK